MRLRVPGNILLSGEYLILEEGGEGVALAVDRYFQLTAHSGSEWYIKSIYPDKEVLWSPDNDPFLNQLLKYLHSIYPDIPAQHIILDSTDLYSSERKIGLGSSACTAVALTALFDQLYYNSRRPVNDFVQTAVCAHRYAQGNKGSAYDVLTSLYGGMGVFKGGTEPGWKAVPFPLVSLAIFHGENAISSSQSIMNYLDFKKRKPHLLKKYLHKNEEVIRMALEGKWEEFFQKAKKWGVELGSEIQVNSRICAPHTIQSDKVKAVGAGNETGIIWNLDKGIDDPSIIPIDISKEGLQWL